MIFKKVFLAIFVSLTLLTFVAPAQAASVPPRLVLQITVDALRGDLPNRYYDWLTQYLFDSVEEVQDCATRWLWTYNHERPNMGLGGITPIQKLAMLA